MVSSCCRRHDTSQNEVQVEREYKKDYETSTTQLHEQQIIKSMYKVRTRGTIMRELSLENTRSPRVKIYSIFSNLKFEKKLFFLDPVKGKIADIFILCNYTYFRLLVGLGVGCCISLLR